MWCGNVLCDGQSYVNRWLHMSPVMSNIILAISLLSLAPGNMHCQLTFNGNVMFQAESIARNTAEGDITGLTAQAQIIFPIKHTKKKGTCI